MTTPQTGLGLTLTGAEGAFVALAVILLLPLILVLGVVFLLLVALEAATDTDILPDEWMGRDK